MLLIWLQIFTVLKITLRPVLLTLFHNQSFDELRDVLAKIRAFDTLAKSCRRQKMSQTDRHVDHRYRRRYLFVCLFSLSRFLNSNWLMNFSRPIRCVSRNESFFGWPIRNIVTYISIERPIRSLRLFQVLSLLLFFPS